MCHADARTTLCKSVTGDRLVGLVVKASASGAEDPGFESRLRRDFPGRVIPVTQKLALQWLPWDWSACCQYTVTG